MYFLFCLSLESMREMSHAELERKASLNIERWLKDKFREGFRSMKGEFEKYDPHRIGKVGKIGSENKIM